MSRSSVTAENPPQSLQHITQKLLLRLRQQGTIFEDDLIKEFVPLFFAIYSL
jgi:hypothetical protein